MATEDEQNEVYRDMAVQNAYDVLFERFCRVENAFKFQEATLEEKRKIIREIAEEII